MLVTGLSGSLRAGSHNRMLLRAAAAQLQPGTTLEVWEGLQHLPPYSSDTDVSPVPAVVEDLRRTLARADAVLIATPEYNHSIPGQLKNALDWASRPYPDNALRDKPVAVIGASTGLFGAIWAQAETRKVLAAIGARIIDEGLAVGSAHDAFAGDGSLRDPALRAQLGALLGRLAAAPAERPRVAA